MRILLVVFTLVFASPIKACDIALALAVDISGSVDPGEFGVQMNGLAEALNDGTVGEALVHAQAAISVIQWTGASRQEVSIPWVRVRSFDDLEALAQRIQTTPRSWRNFSTAIGEALKFVLPTFDQVDDCKRRVIDVSGDGKSNEGVEPLDVQDALKAAGVTVNALVIEGIGDDLTGYFWENVIVGEGAFVVTANGFEEYPKRMRRKLLREVTKQVSGLNDPVTGSICDHEIPTCDHKG